jgi:hypothetical protein
MVARIAPSPINTNVAIGDALTHAPFSGATMARQGQSSYQPPAQQTAQNTSSNVPAPPTVPGEAFAAAVIAGQLPPRPTTITELRQRLGSSWQPPSSNLRLLDRVT